MNSKLCIHFCLYGRYIICRLALDRTDILSSSWLTLYNACSLVQLSLSAEQCQEAVSHLWRMEGCRGCIQNQWICHRPELTLSLLKSRNINQTYTHVWFQGWNGARLTKHTQPPGLLLLFSITVIHNGQFHNFQSCSFITVHGQF